MEMTNTDGFPVWPPEARIRELPYVVTKLLMGAKMVGNYQEREDVAAVVFEGGFTQVLSSKDLNDARQIRDSVQQLMEVEGWGDGPWSASQVLEVQKIAQDMVVSQIDHRAGKRGIVMHKDTTGCGFWRMVLPAHYMKNDDWYVDVTSADVQFEHLLEYDTIFVQRAHDWESYYTLLKLKQMGKRIIYDMDDDMFNIPEDNPASKIIRLDQQAAALKCMDLAHEVTTTTPILQDRLMVAMEGRAPKVIPNALDPEDGWHDIKDTGSPDGKKRIFWQGSATHEEDWRECFDAVNEVLRARDNVILVIMGYLPKLVYRATQQRDNWKDRVEYMSFSDPETYFGLLKAFRADVALAPLKDTPFNQAKSPIKFLEYSLCGIPTVASNVSPYKEHIRHEENGYLASCGSDWYEAIVDCLDSDKKRKSLVEVARMTSRNSFNIRDTAKMWENVLCQ